MKGKKLLVSLLTAVALVAVTAVPVMAAAVEQTETASVTVNEVISATVTDAGDAGINFGSLDAGASDQKEIEQNGFGAVNIAVAAETNVVCKIGTKGKGDFGIEVTTGTATGGSTTTLIDTATNFVTANVEVGMTVVVREGTATVESATITSITQTTNPNDTLNFGAITTAVSSADTYRVLSASFAIGQAKWDEDSNVAGATAMTTSYVQIGTDTTPGTARSQEVWHWISIPGGQVAGSYSTTFYYKADTTL